MCAMESTGVFWKPIYNLLEGHLEVMVVNAQHIKAVPGRKTDIKKTLFRFGNGKPRIESKTKIMEGTTDFDDHITHSRDKKATDVLEDTKAFDATIDMFNTTRDDELLPYSMLFAHQLALVLWVFWSAFRFQLLLM